ncbi:MULTISPECIES: helix-turn-helix domain-containing protein [Caproicibacterium]|uniref:Helix-turn-helix domain-containing protein n=1 Tax=Caproicibacterium argilliputei TaxID=3030016 RepID=A0AA97DBY1_9FIRM|nr:helix-turn-helix domain-containing protein [Caproicibacterium argilliputei]WOC32962.1 helix-turn-helix domain-containing protein [Caproicibacterium argilliputei]
MPKGIPNKRYTPEFKVMVVETMRKEKLSYCEAARQFEVSDSKRIASWERIYLTEGPEGLAVERRGRASAASGTRKGRPAKLPLKVEEDLIAENQRLRAEVAYLKNLQALVLEDERKARKKRW